MVHIAYKICVHQLFMVSVRLLVNSRLLAVKFWGSQKLSMYFELRGGSPQASVSTRVNLRGQQCPFSVLSSTLIFLFFLLEYLHLVLYPHGFYIK